MQTITPRIGESVRNRDTGYEGVIEGDAMRFHYAGCTHVKYPQVIGRPDLPGIVLVEPLERLLFLDRPIREQVEAVR